MIFKILPSQFNLDSPVKKEQLSEQNTRRGFLERRCRGVFCANCLEQRASWTLVCRASKSEERKDHLSLTSGRSKKVKVAKAAEQGKCQRGLSGDILLFVTPSVRTNSETNDSCNSRPPKPAHFSSGIAGSCVVLSGGMRTVSTEEKAVFSSLHSEAKLSFHGRSNRNFDPPRSRGKRLVLTSSRRASKPLAFCFQRSVHM